MSEQNFYDVIKRIVEKDLRYRSEAYVFMNDAVAYTVRKKKDPDTPPRRTRHVAGPELIKGCIEFGVQEYGPLVWTVFQDWGLTTGRAIGDVVFNMIHEGLLTASPTDSPKDFSGIGSLEPLFPKFADEENINPPPKII